MWAQDDRFATLALRKQNEDELERLVEEWVLKHPAIELMNKLQAAGIRAGFIETPDYFFDKDPQLKSRGYAVAAPHAVLGTMRYASPPARFSLTPHSVGSPPCLGEHNEYVCCQLLGISDGEFAELVAEGVVE